LTAVSSPCTHSINEEVHATQRSHPMLTNSRDIKRRLEREGWILDRVTGSHHVFRHPHSHETIVLPHPKKDLGPGLVRAIYKQPQWQRD
jgi:predicted RNA binding protein YcfA (HicA-like mRNA interferase family)